MRLKKRVNLIQGIVARHEQEHSALCRRVAEQELLTRQLCPHTAVYYIRDGDPYWRFCFVCEACGETWQFGEGGLPARFRKILEACGAVKPKKGSK